MSDDKKSKDIRKALGFDPASLERIAEAAKILDKSQNAKNAFELAMKKDDKDIVTEKIKLK